MKSEATKKAVSQEAPGEAGGRRGLVLFDVWLKRLAGWFATFGGIALIVMAFLGVANILASKIFGQAVANTNEIIDYSLILVVYCAVAHSQLGMGLLRVDIFSRKFPRGLNKAVDAVGSLVGACIYAFAAYQAIALLTDHYDLKTKAAASVHSFIIWPFTAVYVIGSFFLALSLLWTVVKMFTLREPPVTPPQPIGVAKEVAK